MSCIGDTCGVPQWGGPKPGDPNNNGALSAKPTVGGVELSWTMPTVNPFAVAHTIVYRSISNQYVNAIQLAVWNGDQYLDRVASGTQYWYWIRFISVNGTEGELIGPASAHAYDTVQQILQELTERIDAGKLARALREAIDRIPSIGNEVKKEIADRIAANLALSQFMGDLDANIDQVLTLVSNEITQRTEGDAVILDAVNTIAVGQGDTVALITEERRLRIDADSALSEKVDLTYSQVGDDISSAVQTVTSAYSDADRALAEVVVQTYATKNGLTAAIQGITQVITDGDSVLAHRIDTLESSGGIDNTARAAIQEEAEARVNADGALAERITTLETTDDNGNLAQIEEKLTATANKVDGVGAMYTLKTNVNGLLGGMGTYNDGTTVQAVWDVDEFIVGRTGPDAIRPFMIVDGVVYINTAFINSLTVDKITSGNMDAEWRINGINGRLVFDNGVHMKVQGTGFGANRDLIEWFGPSMAINQCSKANGINWEAANGDAYYGGALRAGVLYNSRRTSDTAYDASIELGPFGSNGRTKEILVSYYLGMTWQYESMGLTRFTTDNAPNYANLIVYRSFNGGPYEQVATLPATGGNPQIENASDGPDYAQLNISGSVTFTDQGPAGSYKYKVQLINRSSSNVTHTSGSATGFTLTQEISVASTEQ